MNLLLNILKKLGCSHKWERYYVTEAWSKKSKLPTKIFHTLICKDCGKIKRIEV